MAVLRLINLLGFLLLAAAVSSAAPPFPQVRQHHWNDTEPAASVDNLSRMPSMFGDALFQPIGSINTNRAIDRLVVLADELDASTPLPLGAMTITENGPVAVFETGIASVQEIQQLLRLNQPFPAANLLVLLTDDATLTTAKSVPAIQSQLTASGLPYEIIAVIAPPAGYQAGVETLFVARNGTGGITVFNQANSGALIQGGDLTLDPGDDLDAYYFFDYITTFNIDSPFSSSVRTGTIKVANGGTPLPTTRFIFDYGLYTGVGFQPGGTTLNRFVTGFEQAFFDGLFSLELRLPFAATSSNDIRMTTTSIAADHKLSFGNLTSFFKVLLTRSDRFGLSAGLALTLPTAPETRIGDAGNPLVQIDNDAVHLGPFIGWAYAPNDRWFAQGFMQFDFAANGHDVRFNPDGTELRRAGILNDATFAFLDLGAGYWIAPHSRYRRPTAVMAELHYSGTISDSDVVRAGGFQVGNNDSNLEILQSTLGISTQLSPGLSLAAGYVAPLTGDKSVTDGGGQFRVEFRP